MSRILPAGHASSIEHRAHTVEPVSDLEKAFLEFRRLSQSNFERDYWIAKNLLQGTEIPLSLLHPVMMKYHGANREDGLFLSAAYNLCKENVIVYDLDTPLTLAGVYLPEDKLLVNRGRFGQWLGLGSRGVIVNVGHTGYEFGFYSEGIIINAGHTGPSFGGTRNGTGITLREPVSYGLYSGTRIRPDNMSCRLKEYTEELAELCHEPTEHIYKRYGNNPSTTIQHDISKLLKENER